MRVAPYSAMARRRITEVKEFIANLNYNSASVADIRAIPPGFGGIEPGSVRSGSD